MWRTTVNRHLIPSLSFQHSSGFFLVCSAPLLEEKGNARMSALLLDIQHPIHVHRTRLSATFSTHNNPINLFEIKIWQWADQGFQGQELHFGPGLTKSHNAI